jgi:hypothetical protein
MTLSFAVILTTGAPGSRLSWAFAHYDDFGRATFAATSESVEKI